MGWGHDSRNEERKVDLKTIKTVFAYEDDYKTGQRIYAVGEMDDNEGTRRPVVIVEDDEGFFGALVVDGEISPMETLPRRRYGHLKNCLGDIKLLYRAAAWGLVINE